MVQTGDPVLIATGRPPAVKPWYLTSRRCEVRRRNKRWVPPVLLSMLAGSAVFAGDVERQRSGSR